MRWDDRIGRRLRLKDLHTLQTVAEAGSMAKASERLALSQPAISKAVSDMEHTLGAPLLDRSSRGVELTESASPDEFTAYVRAEYEKMKKLMRVAGIKPE